MTEEIKLKNEINAYFQSVYDISMHEGKRGNYESMFHALHKTIEVFCVQPVSDGISVEEKIKRYERDKIFWHIVRCGIYLIAAIKVIDWFKSII